MPTRSDRPAMLPGATRCGPTRLGPTRHGLTRRGLLAGAAALPLLPRGGMATSAQITLEPRPARVQLLPAEFPETDLWLFDGALPGPEIRVRQGGRVARRLVNGLPVPTSVHWHGIRLDNAMDGVPGMTQDPVPPGGAFDYSFVAPDAGTYWYHSHLNSPEQVARGLYGPLIVEEATPPDIDRDLVLTLDDWRLETSGALSEPFDAPHDRSHAGRIGNYATTNGDGNLVVRAGRHERLRLRLINTSTARIYEVAGQGLDGWVVALDGMPLAAPEPLAGTLRLAPAQRADLIVDIVEAEGSEAFLISVEAGEGFAQATFPVGPALSQARRGPPAPLPPNAEAPLALGDARAVEIRMEGGAMGGLQEAIFEDRRAGMRELAQANQFWALNGVVGLADAPAVEAARGETIRFAFRNDTAFPHGMHLHGHHFREVLPGGATGPMRDTLLVSEFETREIAFVADNPGDWLVHCHMLAHQDAGMKTWMRVA